MAQRCILLFAKSHVRGYARKDGSYVAEHEDSRVSRGDAEAMKMADDKAAGRGNSIERHADKKAAYKAVEVHHKQLKAGGFIQVTPTGGAKDRRYNWKHEDGSRATVNVKQHDDGNYETSIVRGGA